MAFIQKIIAALAYSNFWISFGSTALCFQYYILDKQKPDLFILLFVFCSTVLTYTFQRFEKIRTKKSGVGPRIDWMSKRMTFSQWLMYAMLIAVIFFAVSLSWVSLIILGIAGFLSLFYVKKLPIGKGTNLRDVPHLKIYLIAFTWALITVFLPWLNTDTEYTSSLILLFAGNFFFVLAITIPFDIRDVELDEIAKRTIPQVAGVYRSKVIAVNLAVVGAACLWFFRPDLWMGIMLSLFLTTLLILLSRKSRSDIFYSFFIDGILLIQPAFLWLDATLM